ncbi:F-box/LRR-repeat protein 14 [Apostasia shenzhenica]|uniref:F-box/LRR-repeat protein 14 n=1 Tax=Apostasia shenzhenica TaxID=1088818 RepID=A0A2H9ZYF9_9ASPA|nr:F-box/LRR-repeat protein 14 [Apostasia shenzhenica]
MEDLPEPLLLDVLRRIDRTADRNSVSLACKRMCRSEGEQRDFLRVGCGLHPAVEALTALCVRFPNLSKLEIDYSGWMSSSGRQLGNQGLQVLSSHCPSLKELSLSFCSFINDTGLGHLSSCSNLISLKLNFAPAVSCNGILSIALGCKNLTTLELIRCMKVNSVEWLQILGKFGNLRDLSIKNCRGIREDDLVMLGSGWRKLRRLEFSVDAYYRYPRIHDQSSFSECCKQFISCDKLKELSLTNCIISPGQGLSFVLGRCLSLEKLRLHMCIGITDREVIELSQNSTDLRSFSLRLPSQFTAPVLLNSPLSNESLRALAGGCRMLDELELSFSDGEFPSVSCFGPGAVIGLIQSCPIRTLKLQGAYFFNDIGMEAICSSPYLQVLELCQCQEVSDEGMMLLVHFPCLRVLKLCKCLGITDSGLKPLAGLEKLDSLIVEDCPQISEKGIEGAARSLSYRQDLTWLY